MRLSPAPSLFKNKRKEVPEQAELRRKTGQRGLLITSCKRLEKDSDGATAPAAEAVRVPSHSAAPGSPQAKQLRHLQAQASLGQSCHRQKSPGSVHAGSLGSFPTLCDPTDCVLPGFSDSGASRQQHWSVLANNGCHTLLETVFPVAPAGNSPEDLVLPEPL